MLVGINDIKTYMDISLTARQEDAAEIILAGLQSELEGYLRRPIEVTEFEEEHVLPSNHTGLPMGSFLTTMHSSGGVMNAYTSTGSVDSTTWAYPPPTIYLKNSPVVAISEVVVKPIFGAERVLVVEQDYTKRVYGLDYYYGYSDDRVTVTYTAGLDGATIPVFKLLILRAATREMQNMHDDVVGVKDLNPRNVAATTTGFFDTELSSVRRYRRVRV